MNLQSAFDDILPMPAFDRSGRAGVARGIRRATAAFLFRPRRSDPAARALAIGRGKAQPLAIYFPPPSGWLRWPFRACFHLGPAGPKPNVEPEIPAAIELHC